MKLYHVTTDFHHNGIIQPRIPLYRNQEEDNTIPRFCVATSIQGCLTAIPNGSNNLANLLEETDNQLLVMEIDTDTLQIPPHAIYTDTTLYQNNLVQDAFVTGEHWITTSFVVPASAMFLITINTWEEVAESIIPYSITLLADDEYDGDYEEAYFDVCGRYCPSLICIESVQYDSQPKQPVY